MLADNGAAKIDTKKNSHHSIINPIKLSSKTFWFTCDGENRFHTFTSDGIVDIAQVFAGIFHFGLLDDQRTADLLDTIIQLDWLLGGTSFHVLVPSNK